MGLKNSKPRTSKAKANVKMKNHVSHKDPCKCLTCHNAKRKIEKIEDQTILVCGEEACFMNCESCTERPNWCDGYTEEITKAVSMG